MIKRAGSTLGFTLIEMAIVVVVIGLLLSGGIVAVTPIVQNSKVSETKSKLDRVEQALLLHVIRYGCLPCPAAPAGTTGQAVAGGTPYSSGCQTGACTNVQGVLPWANLDISENDASDAFGNRFSYRIGTNLQNTDGMRRTPPSTYPVGTLDVSDATPTQLTLTAAYVVISHGSDRVYGYRMQTGAQVTADPNGSTLQDNNNNTAEPQTVPYIQDDLRLTTGAGYYDDIVRWRSAPFIIQLCGSNACGNPS